ncbi:hypothetical protein ACFRMQ_27555 [Kitasatospora sp. NPDC056783]|uniref:hypothetical protein n=1 Tax=Kitasatospora sp. NPDC056783 TaxID=3345943 RepID=UPI0036CD9E9C
MTIPPDDALCGLCGRPTDARQHDHHPEPAGGREAGERVEYVVVEVRGALARYRRADDPGARAHRTVAPDLAARLGVGPADLAGRHFTCRQVPDPDGVTMSDFRLVAR